MCSFPQFLDSLFLLFAFKMVGIVSVFAFQMVGISIDKFQRYLVNADSTSTSISGNVATNIIKV